MSKENFHTKIKLMKDKGTYKIETLLNRLSANDFLTAEQIAEDLGVSTKTARTRMAELAALIRAHGAQILSRPRYGYQLQIDDPVKWDDYLRSRSLTKETEAGTPKERSAYIALSLLMAADYIKISDFADELYVSSQVVSDTLKECESFLCYYKLSIERKPYYGLRLIGREFDKRNCIISSFPNDFKSFLHVFDDEQSMSKQVIETVMDTLMEHRVHLTEVSLQSAAAYVYLSLARYRSGFQITSDDEADEEMMKDRAYTAACEIFEKLADDISDSEKYYLGVYISAMRSNDVPEYHNNIIITRKIDAIVNEIFDVIRDVFGVSFHNDLRLHMMLAQHLMSLDLRIRYHIPLQNTMYMNIDKDFPYAYSIANEALSVLAKEYDTFIDPSESEWLALIFATGLQDMKASKKLNVLVVCQEGRASSQLLKYQIQKNYSEYVDDVRIVTVYDFEQVDLSDIDYIFSTVNIPFHTNIPILMVDNLALFQKSSLIENELLSHRMSAIDRFFSEDLFFTNLKGSTKEEILASLCEKISAVKKLPDHFYESLMEREILNSTDYAPNVAIPHPSRLIPEEDTVAVAILDKPVFWGRNDIQLILLTALSLKNEEATQLFYEVTSHFITNKKSVSILLKNPSYETLIGLLSAVDLR